MSVSMVFLAAALATGKAPVQQPSSALPKVAVEGCVETDGVEKMGLDRRFILTNGKVVKGKAPRVATPGSADAAATRSAMYRLHGLTDEQLKLHVGRRVRIDGSFGDLDELVELNVATIRQIPGECSVPRS
jgi:hypothetical protein